MPYRPSGCDFVASRVAVVVVGAAVVTPAATNPGNVRDVPRSMDLTASSPHPIESIRAAFADPAYWEFRLGYFDVGAPTLDALHTDAAGTTTVEMSMHFGADQLPGPVQKLRLGAMHVVQRETWHAVAGGATVGTIAVDARKTPISGRGSVHLRAAPPGTDLAGTAEVVVNVPLIGGTIASFLGGHLSTGILDIVEVTDTWLDRAA